MDLDLVTSDVPWPISLLFNQGTHKDIWKAPKGPDTLEISQHSGFHTEKPENPIELG